jgi:radical SAM-linked protein
MLRDAIEGRKAEKQWVRKPVVRAPELPVVQRIRVRVGRRGDARFLGHLEWNQSWFRALRRAGAPLAYSMGFHPLPRIDFSSALPSGEESLAEYMDVRLSKTVDAAALIERLRHTAPPGFVVLGGGQVAVHGDSLMSDIAAWDYELVSGLDHDVLQAAVWSVAEAPELRLTRKSKSGPLELDVKPMIRHLRVRTDGTIELGLGTINGRPGKAREMLGILGLPASTRVLRTEVYTADGRRPFEFGATLVADREAEAGGLPASA